MATYKAHLAIFAALVVAGCASSIKELPVRTDYVRGTSFQEWKTFRFASDVGASSNHHPRYDEMTRQALLDELTSRGYTRIEDGTPDFRVTFELSFRGDSSREMTPKMGSTDPSQREPAGSNPGGSLTIEMLDPESSAVLWEGTISEFTINAIETQKGLQRAVWRVLAEFPPLTG